jgi:hypothetical protein
MQVTTLVPAYKPKYLFELLSSLRHQTVKPAAIVFSDDSPDQAFVRLLEAEPLKSTIADLNVSAIAGPRCGGYNNFRHLLKVWNRQTELFHFLLDDDIIYPAFYERHLHAHQLGRISCSISRRWTATESGQPIRDPPVPAAINAHDKRMLALDADVLFATTVALSANWLGEFSNVVLAAEVAEAIDDPRLDSIGYAGLEDVGTFLNASLLAPVAYINDHLGYFRTSAQQNSADPMGRPMKLAHLAWLSLALAARRMGKLTRAQCAACLAALCPRIAQRYAREADMAPFCALMPELAWATPAAEAQFLDAWSAFAP